MAVGFEMFIQSIALALDVRDVTRSEGVSIGDWIGTRVRNLRSARGQALADTLDPEARALRIAAEAGDRDAVSAAIARRLRICAETLGPTYIKFGQLVGSSVGLLPPEVVDEFARCRDAARPESFATIRRRIESELGPLSETFSRFDAEPIAAASIAQVHAAQLRDGREVAVKVQRPGIRKRMERDAALLYSAATAADAVDLMETANLPGMIELFTACLLEELDFRLEAENMAEFAILLEQSGVTDVCVPRPIPGMVTETVLVMERLGGRPITRGGAESLGIFRVGTRAVLDTALTHGLFHADLHTGNILHLDDGRFGLVDFGIVGRFDPEQRMGLARWLLSFTGDDVSAQLTALAELGAFGEGSDVDEATEQIEAVIAKVEIAQDPTLDDIASHFELIARILTHHGMRLPRELTLFFKNLIHLSGAVREIDPTQSPTDEMTGLIESVNARPA